MKAVIVSTLLVGVSVGAAAQESLPRTPWGDPDLQGIWFYQIQTPRERPEAFADRAVLSPDEAAAYVAEQHAALESRQTRGDWLIRTGLTGRRTSRIVDPLNGRLPARTPAAQRRADTEGNLWVERAAMDPKTANGGSDASWDGPSRFAACRSSSECRFFKPQTMWPSRTSSASCVWYPSPPERLSLGRFGSGVDGPAGVGRVTRSSLKRPTSMESGHSKELVRICDSSSGSRGTRGRWTTNTPSTTHSRSPAPGP